MNKKSLAQTDPPVTAEKSSNALSMTTACKTILYTKTLQNLFKNSHAEIHKKII